MKNYIILFFALLTTIAFTQTPQWEFMGLAGARIYDIAVDDSINVYVASDGGVYKSTDNGTTWIFKNNGLQIGGVNKLFIDYEGNIYLCGSAGSSEYALYKSSDGGENWVGISDTLNGNPINYFFDFTFIPNEPGGVFYTSNYYGVYRSTDNGITWQSTNFTYPGAVDIGVNKNGYMFFGNNLASWFGIYRSTDLGLNWERHTFLGVTTMIYLRDGSILASAYNPGLGSCGVYKTTDNGSTWFNTNTFSGLYCPIDFVLDTNDDIYAAAGYVYLSTDNGITWLNYGLPGQGATRLAIDSSGYVWAGVDMDGIYRTAGRTVPVELSSFSAEVTGNNVLLSWVTASEINNSGFDIERAVIGHKSSVISEWKRIGFVEGYGTTTETKTYSFNDENLLPGNYSYRLKQIDLDGTFEYSNVIEVFIANPEEYYLSQNYPNPFNPETNIDFIIPEETLVIISIYDVTGRKIKELVNEKKQPGYYTIILRGGELGSGIYFYRLSTSSGYTTVKKLSIIK